MYNQYNPHNLEADFKQHLKNSKYSRTSIINYVSDIRKFLAWFSQMLSRQGLPFDLAYITSASLDRYKAYLRSNGVPVKSVNRSLSSLRAFSKFCLMKGYIGKNPHSDVANVKKSREFSILHPKPAVSNVIKLTLVSTVIVAVLFAIPFLPSIDTSWLKAPGFGKDDEIIRTLGALDTYTASTSADLLTIPVIDEKGSLNLTAPYPKVIGHTGTLGIEAPQMRLQTFQDGPIILNTEDGPMQFLYEGRRPDLPYETAFYFAANDLRTGTVMHLQTEDTSGRVDMFNISSGLPAVSRFRVDSEGNVHIKGNIILDGNLIMSPDAVIFGQVSSDTATSSASPEPIGTTSATL